MKDKVFETSLFVITGKTFQVLQAVDVAEVRGIFTEKVFDERGVQFRCVECRKNGTVLCCELPKAFDDLLIVAGRSKRAALKTGRIDDDKVVRPRFFDAAPLL